MSPIIAALSVSLVDLYISIKTRKTRKSTVTDGRRFKIPIFLRVQLYHFNGNFLMNITAE